MKTVIRFFASLKVSLGLESVEIETESSFSMRDLLSLACEKAGIDFTDKLLEENKTKIRKGTLLLLDGKNIIHMHGLDTMVPPGSTVSFFPPSGGG